MDRKGHKLYFIVELKDWLCWIFFSSLLFFLESVVNILLQVVQKFSQGVHSFQHTGEMWRRVKLRHRRV